VTLDDRFHDLRNEVDREILHARRGVIAQLGRAVARMRAATNQSEWQEAVLDSGREFANDPDALELLGSLATLTAPASPPVVVKSETTAPADPNPNAAALRFARVKIAEIQLYQTDAVRTGRASRDLYGSLKWHLDEAREAYREKFLSNGTETADYLHAEILHALANDDATLMGPGYPGPLA
jgi:hypothetical protein